MSDKIQFDQMFIADSIDESTEFIPIVSDFDEDEIINIKVPENLPILPLRNTVLFPGVIIPITVGRQKSIKLIRDIYSGDKLIGVVSQKDPNIEDPLIADIFQTGTVAQVLKILEMPDGAISIIIQGKNRFHIDEIVKEKPYYVARVSVLNDERPKKKDKEFNAIVGSLKDLSLKIIKLSVNIPPEASFAIKNISNPTFLINFICSNTEIESKDKQKLLEISNLKDRSIQLLGYLTREVQMLELKNEVQSKVKTDLEQQQREFMLQQQMKTIQNELGGNPVDKDIEELAKNGKSKKWGKEVSTAFNKELERLKRLNPASPEYSVQMNYLQILLELPWNEYTKDSFDLKRAEKILEKDHYGLDKVKERILEHLAVLKLKKDRKSPIICLYGPPGVGKTSLGKSIARALKRKYVRMSLGGLHDEAEIRGHRKTYIGAMPGRIMQSLRKIKSANPVFVLDEIDKVGSDFRGDPASAMLEVLDPEQNKAFYDNYLELEFDLSNVMFIATANTTSSIHPALRDRMEMIDVSGYLVEEKIEIARRHLIPKQLKEHGILAKQLVFPAKIIEGIIENYSRESGVRELDKTIAKIARNTAKRIAFEEDYNRTLTQEDIIKIMGPPRFLKDKYQGNEYAGVVTGLAWTAVGGQILYVETSLSKGKGKLTLTGNLGEVMKESAVIALEYLKAHAGLYKIPVKAFDNWNVHVHVPEGAIPKDGPSAGITMATSLASAFTQRKVKNSIAMTGEITLRGKVLPVGGIKEKILAAKRANINEIILSEENRKDIEEIKDIYIKGLKFHYVSEISEVLDIALLKEKVKGAIEVK